MSVIIDSSYTLQGALANSSAPQEVFQPLGIVDVTYYGFDGKLHQGQIVIHKAIKEDVIHLFKKIITYKFPIASVIPAIQFDNNDQQSMQANNSYGFCYRLIEGSKSILSNHAYGLAIDLNPVQNPCIKDGKVVPKGATYNPATKGTMTANSDIVQTLKQKGWIWGGDWQTPKDYQHFEKPKNLFSL